MLTAEALKANIVSYRDVCVMGQNDSDDCVKVITPVECKTDTCA